MPEKPHVLKILDEPDKLLGLTLVGHHNLEALLTMILEKQLTAPSAVLSSGTMFAQKVALAEGVGAITSDMATSLRAINKVRNKYAHRLGFALSFDEAFDLVKVVAANGVDFSDDTIHQDKAKSEQWYGTEGVLREVLMNTFTDLAWSVQDDLPDILDLIA